MRVAVYDRLRGWGVAVLWVTVGSPSSLTEPKSSSARVSGASRAYQPETHLIPLVLEAATGRRGSVSIYGTDYATHDGTAIRDYIHVEDLARAHLLALEGRRRREARRAQGLQPRHRLGLLGKGSPRELACCAGLRPARGGAG